MMALSSTAMSAADADCHSVTSQTCSVFTQIALGIGDGMNSRRKGADRERQLANLLKEHGYDTRRGQQYSGANGDADVVGLPLIHIECKGVENLSMKKAMEQSVRDAREGETPVVMYIKRYGRWQVNMFLDDWIPMYEAYRKEHQND